MSYMNLVHGKARHKSFVAQWLEHPTGVRKVIGLSSVGDSVSFLSSGSACDMLITSFLISSPRLNGVYHLSLFIRKHLCKLKGGNIFLYKAEARPRLVCFIKEFKSNFA